MHLRYGCSLQSYWCYFQSLCAMPENLFLRFDSRFTLLLSFALPVMYCCACCGTYKKTFAQYKIVNLWLRCIAFNTVQFASAAALNGERGWRVNGWRVVVLWLYLCFGGINRLAVVAGIYYLHILSSSYLDSKVHLEIIILATMYRN